ncbi:hypothetical protein EVAR_6999_1 [Eumeta japonica]|uniref:Uncharacterized protein n=1 Tax=Eumeta variegata TaxID=151549 RepID=A0A4C1TGN4_EUMVA|nr:hypothetical protein EVAR_6999_1 [Eumeta japonica]
MAALVMSPVVANLPSVREWVGSTYIPFPPKSSGYPLFFPPFIPKAGGNALMTYLRLRVFMGGGDDLLSSDSHARLPLSML